MCGLSYAFFYFQALIPKLKDQDPNPGVVTSVLQSIGDLAQVYFSNWFALKAVQTFEFGGMDKKCVYTHITLSRFLAYELVILIHMIITQYKVLFK